MGERLSGRQEVGGSNPLISTKYFMQVQILHKNIHIFALAWVGFQFIEKYNMSFCNSYDMALLLKYSIYPEKIRRAIKKYNGNHITINNGNLVKVFWRTKNVAKTTIVAKKEMNPAFVTSWNCFSSYHSATLSLSFITSQ